MKKVASVILSLILLLGFGTGCGGELLEGIDPNRTQIYVSLFQSGYGQAWLDKIKVEFEKDYPEYQIMIDSNKTENATIKSSLQSQSTKFNIFFTPAPYTIKEMIAADVLEDLSDLYEEKPDGENGETVRGKMKDSQLYESAFSLEGKEGVYAIPYGDSFTGFVYDHDLFLERGWLLTDDGWLINNRGKELTAGRDGKPGTYDDGQPVTESEWLQMIQLINGSGDTAPFYWSSNYAYSYTNPIVHALIAQYEGLTGYNTFLNYQGPDPHSNKAITLEKGYEVYSMEGVGNALQFMDERVAANCLSSSLDYASHTDAQNNYLYGYVNASADRPQAAFLLEGIWWENEAKPTLTEMPEGRKYGQRTYNYMLPPAFDGQLGIDGEGAGTVFASQDAGMTFIAKNSDRTLVEMCKKFVLYTLKDRNLRNFTVETGSLKPYRYELDETDLSNMTPFAKNVWNIYSDEANVAIIRPEIEKLASAINYATTKGDSLATKSGLQSYSTPLVAFAGSRGIGWNEYWTGMQALNKDSWSGWYDEYLAYMGE